LGASGRFAGRDSDSKHAKSGIEAISVLAADFMIYRPGENSAAAAVWPFRKAFSKCSAYALSLSSAPSALAKPNLGFLMQGWVGV